MEQGLIGTVTRLIVANDGTGGDHRGRSVSTPCQPAYAILKRSMPVKAGECRALSEWKSREIKGLSRKSLVLLSYWNRWGFGS